LAFWSVNEELFAGPLRLARRDRQSRGTPGPDRVESFRSLGDGVENAARVE
jgi:hypothetical protein